MNETMIYTVKEVAKLLHCSPNYIYKLIECGYLPAIRLGSIKILKSSIEQFLMKNVGKDFSDLNNISNFQPVKDENK